MNQEGSSQSPSKHSLSSSSSTTSTSTEPVRSRWSPKPEQILILESIFNSGIVNPPKDETVKIRKMLEKFGAVGDANVFYWFQNRRSRSRRRQRQLQSTTVAVAAAEDYQHMISMHHDQYVGARACHEVDLGFGSCSNDHISSLANNNNLFSESLPQVSSILIGLNGGCESNNNGMEENLFTMYGHEHDHHHHHHHYDQQSLNTTSSINPSDQNSNFQYQQGVMTVFINGVATEVTKGAIDIKAMFGEDLVLIHSSGFALPTDEFGFLIHSLQHGQAYFLVPRQT